MSAPLPGLPMSGPDSELFERIVREVLRRLAEMGIGVTAAPSEAAELVLADRVVALATLAGRLTGVQRVVVGMRAVVTPAARDELRGCQIELLRR